MRLPVPALLLAAVWGSGCATNNEPVFQPLAGAANGALVPDAIPTADKTGARGPLIITPDAMLTGRVSVYNEAGRFVVLDFPIGQLPANEQVMFVFRQGLKVGEVKVTGPQRDHNTVADLISGEARKGDEIRAR